MAPTAIYNTYGTSGGNVNNVNGNLTYEGDRHNFQGGQNNIQGNYQKFQGDQNNIRGNYQNFLGDHQNIHAGRGALGIKSEGALKALQGTRGGEITGSSPPNVYADSTSWPSAAAKIPDPPISLRPRSSPSALRTVQPLEQLAEEVLSLTPAACLKRIWDAFQYIWADHIQRAQASKGQLRALARSIAQLLRILNEQYRSVNITESDTAFLDSLHGVLEEIGRFLCKLLANSEPLKLLLSKGDRIARIDAYQSEILTCVRAFQISPLCDMQQLQTAIDEGRAADQNALSEQLDAMDADPRQFKKGLDIQDSNMTAMMVSVQRYLKDDAQVGDDRERRFFERVARHLSYESDVSPDFQNWMVSTYDVELHKRVGSGGFAQVWIGRWKSKEVAVKMFQSQEGVAPQPQVVREEIETWSKLRHPNVLEFLAANVSDDRPFIVMSYMKNGNARDYLKSHPNSDRIKLLHDASLGLRHLHKSGIIHGDIKAANILIDDEGRAVISDFGLSRVKTAITSSTSRHIGKSTARKSTAQGSRYWMAPELFKGGRPGFPCDVYSFGMTIYEILAGEVPLGHLDPDALVATLLLGPWGARPLCPSGISEGDRTWVLAVDCWQISTSQRPSAGDICARLEHAMANMKVSRDARDSSNSSEYNSRSRTSEAPYTPVGMSHPLGEQSMATHKPGGDYAPPAPAQPARRQTEPNPFRRNWPSETSRSNS